MQRRLCFPVVTIPVSPAKVLKIYNWADYIGDGVLEDFQAYYKEQNRRGYSYCLSNFRYQRNHVDQDRKKGHEDFDVVCPSEYIIERMLKKDLLLPIVTVFPPRLTTLNDVSPLYPGTDR